MTGDSAGPLVNTQPLRSSPRWHAVNRHLHPHPENLEALLASRRASHVVALVGGALVDPALWCPTHRVWACACRWTVGLEAVPGERQP